LFLIKVLVACLQTKEHAFQSKASAEFAKLRTVQAELEQEAGQACFLGCSVTQTGLPCLSSSGLPPWEALVMIAEKRKLSFL